MKRCFVLFALLVASLVERVAYVRVQYDVCSIDPFVTTSVLVTTSKALVTTRFEKPPVLRFHDNISQLYPRGFQSASGNLLSSHVSLP